MNLTEEQIREMGNLDTPLKNTVFWQIHALWEAARLDGLEYLKSPGKWTPACDLRLHPDIHYRFSPSHVDHLLKELSSDYYFKDIDVDLGNAGNNYFCVPAGLLYGDLDRPVYEAFRYESFVGYIYETPLGEHIVTRAGDKGFLTADDADYTYIEDASVEPPKLVKLRFRLKKNDS